MVTFRTRLLTSACLWGLLCAPAAADRLVMSGATFSELYRHDRFTTPAGQSFDAPARFWSAPRLLAEAGDSVVFDFETGAYTVYHDLSPYALVTGHADFDDIDAGYDVAVWSRATRLFHVGLGRSGMDAAEAISFVGRFPYASLTDAELVARIRTAMATVSLMPRRPRSVRCPMIRIPTTTA